MTLAAALLRNGIVLALLLSPLPALAAFERIHDYTIRMDDGLNSMGISACFEGRMPKMLYAGNRTADRVIQAPHIRQGERRIPLEADANRLRIRGEPDDHCVHYRINLSLAARARSISLGAQVGSALVISPRTWLWRPQDLNPYSDIRLHFDLPDDMSIQGAWALDEDYESNDEREETEQAVSGPVFRLGYPPLGWDSDFIVGQFDRASLDSGRVQVALADGPADPLDASITLAWLESGLEAAKSILGGLPQERGQVIVIPLSSGDRPVARGRVSRAGGISMILGMSTQQEEDAYKTDGLIAHEFIHWLHPPVAPDHRWLPEGLATYYQYIGMARAGHMSPEEAWKRFMEDLDDGLWDRRPGTVLDLARRMNRDGGANFVYWASAAMMLIADVSLREGSDNEFSLDHALAEWAQCCMDSRRSADGRDVMDQMDELIEGQAIFRALYDDHVLSVGFPDIEALLKQLGLPQPGEDFELNDEAPLAPIRQAIMRPHEQSLLEKPEDKETQGS